MTPKAIAALAFARKEVAWHRENAIDLLGMQVQLLDPAAGERYGAYHFAQMIGAGMIDPAYAADEARAGDRLFYDAICELAAAELEGKFVLDATLRQHVVEILRTTPRLWRSRRLETNFFRNLAITMLVQRIHELFGLNKTAGPTMRRESGCGIVADAMGLNYETVRAVVDKFDRKI